MKTLPILVYSFISIFFQVARLESSCSCPTDVTFTVRPEWAGPYSATPNVDVNLGNVPETFIEAAYWQIAGVAPPPAFVTDHANRLRTWGYWRRIDVVNTILDSLGSSTPRVYSDPWTSQPALLEAPGKTAKRDIGGVLMMFFNCPGGVNCGMHWANNHALGMETAHSLLGFGGPPTGFHDPDSNAGFFYRELMDARYAGLQFLMPNVYGPDLIDGRVANLVTALNAIEAQSVTPAVKVALFDDTWGWWDGSAGYNFPPWNNPPDMNSPAQTNNAADKIYLNKWKPFYQAVPSQHWYRVGNRPLVYFYNSGHLSPRGNSAAVINQIKALFLADFGVEPWVVVDLAFFDDAAMAAEAESRFTWKTVYNPGPTIINNKSRYVNGGITLDHAMVRWDPHGRDTGGSTSWFPNGATEMIKGSQYLQAALQNSTDADILVLASWNDLGEGTGVNRAMDYYYAGDWQAPTHFMDMIRHSQSQSFCPPVPGTAFGGTPIPIPGTVQAEAFDLGGELRAYHDLQAANFGTSSYRSTEGVDLDICLDAGGGTNVSYAYVSEWLEYKVDVTIPGLYNVLARVASPSAGGKFHLEMEGVSICSGTLANSGGYQTWVNLSLGSVTLTAGIQTLKLALDTNAPTGRVGNFNYFTFSLAAGPSPTPSFTATLSMTASRTHSQTQTATPTQTPSYSPTLTLTSSPSSTPSALASATPSFSHSPTMSATPTGSGTMSETPIQSPSPSPTESLSHTQSPSASATPSSSPTDTATLSSTETPSFTASATLTQTCTLTPYYSPTETVSETKTLTVTLTPSASPSAVALPTNGAVPDIEKVLMLPNPVLASGTSIPEAAFLLKGDADEVELRIYAKSSMLVTCLNVGARSAGWARCFVPVAELGSGIYFVKIRARARGADGKAALGTIMLVR